MTPEWKAAVKAGDAGVLRTMLDAGADANARDEHGQTALMNAARDGHTEVVRLLVERGADLNHTAKYHLSALMLAVINGRDAIVGILADAGADLVMLESEGVTENVTTWRTDVITRVVDALGLEKVMFEAADPEVFAWYVKTYGPEVNLFVDHSQIVQLECLRSGVWGTKSLWGRVLTYKG